mgnify:CR=1 FL=1
MADMDISEVVRSSGLPASTLRYYDELGLIHSTGRLGLKRLFKADVLERLALIGLGRQAGFSLQEIAGMFAADGRPSLDRKLLAIKADELDRTVRRLSAMRDGLRHAANCPAPDHMACPTFRRLVNLAGKRQAGGARKEVISRRQRTKERSNIQ